MFVFRDPKATKIGRLVHQNWSGVAVEQAEVEVKDKRKIETIAV